MTTTFVDSNNALTVDRPCPYDDNELLPERNESSWYWLHCPGCGNTFTFNGVQIPVRTPCVTAT